MKQGRKNTINLLKSKISALQTELIALQNQPHPITHLHPSTRTGNPSRSPSNIDYKSPTFWTRNPINHDDTYYPKKKQLPSPNRTQYTHELKKSASPSLRNILASIDRNFYQTQSTSQLINPPSPQTKHKKQNRHSFCGKRFEFSEFGQQRLQQNSKQSKRKTYQQKRSDVILNPEKQKITRKRLVTAKSRSPDRLYTDHPESNARFYAFPRQVVVVPKKGLLQDKNKSSLSFCSSLGELVPIKFDDKPQPSRKKSQRKHLNQYYRDNFTSHIEFQ